MASIAAFLADAVAGQELGSRDMEPMEISGDAQAGLIGVSDGGPGEEVGHPCFKAVESVVSGGDGVLDGGLADGDAEEVPGHPGDALQGDELLDTQVDQPGVETGAVLRGGDDVRREWRGHLAAGVGANLDFDAALRDDQFPRGRIEDLPGFMADDGLVARGGPASAGAAPQSMDDGAVGVGDLGQGLTWMTGLTARGAVALFARALGFGFGVAIGGRGLVAVAAILGDP